MDEGATAFLSSNILSLGVSGIVLLYCLRKWKSQTHPPFPPGPKGLPLLGNLFDMPQERFCLTFSEWGAQYGPITWITVPGRNIVILNTYDVIDELLDKRGSNNIDRARMVMSAEMIGLDFTTPVKKADSDWRKHRKFFHQALSSRTVKREYADLFQAKAHQYLETIFNQPSDFLSSLKRVLGEGIAELTYGALKHEDGTDYVAKHQELLDYSVRAAAGYVVDLFPSHTESMKVRFIPSWFPGAKFKRDAKEWREHRISLQTMMQDGIQHRMSTGKGQPCYITNLLEDLQRLQDETGADVRADAQLVHESGFSFFQAGADTSIIALKTFLLAMSLHPEVQARARKEIDRVFNDGRSPDFLEQENMPYIKAVVLETFRWNPPAPIGIPHASREDDMYKGYFIPKGTTLIPNQWQVSRDPNIYQSPSTFNPDRFTENSKILDPRDFIFGFGRRICPGNSLAYQITWIFVVSILWAFELKRPEDEPSLEDINDVDLFDLGFISNPHPFRCTFIPRETYIKSISIT